MTEEDRVFRPRVTSHVHASDLVAFARVGHPHFDHRVLSIPELPFGSFGEMQHVLGVALFSGDQGVSGIGREEGELGSDARGPGWAAHEEAEVRTGHPVHGEVSKWSGSREKRQQGAGCSPLKEEQEQ